MVRRARTDGRTVWIATKRCARIGGGFATADEAIGACHAVAGVKRFPLPDPCPGSPEPPGPGRAAKPEGRPPLWGGQGREESRRARALALIAGRSARCFCPTHPGRARSAPPGTPAGTRPAGPASWTNHHAHQATQAAGCLLTAEPGTLGLSARPGAGTRNAPGTLVRPGSSRHPVSSGPPMLSQETPPPQDMRRGHGPSCPGPQGRHHAPAAPGSVSKATPSHPRGYGPGGLLTNGRCVSLRWREV